MANIFDKFDDVARGANALPTPASPKPNAFDRFDSIPSFRAPGKSPKPKALSDGPLRPSEAFHEGIKDYLGETVANASKYVPALVAPKIVGDMWADLYVREKANPEGNDGVSMLAQQTNLLDAASQGVSPHVESHTLIGPVSSESAGGMKFYRDAQGGEQPFDASTQVILTDPQTGKQSVYLKEKIRKRAAISGPREFSLQVC